MQTTESQQIISRFFEALKILKSEGAIRGKKTFTDRYGINRWNFNTLVKEPQRDIFQVSWLGYLVKDYGVSADWLLTGRGKPLKGKLIPTKKATQASSETE